MMNDHTHDEFHGPYDSPDKSLEASGTQCVFVGADVKAVRAGG